MGWLMLFPGASDAGLFPLDALRRRLDEHPQPDRAGERSRDGLAVRPITEATAPRAVGDADALTGSAGGR